MKITKRAVQNELLRKKLRGSLWHLLVGLQLYFICKSTLSRPVLYWDSRYVGLISDSPWGS